MDEREKLYDKKASTSQNSVSDKRVIMENGNWTNVKTTESTTHSLKPDKNSNDAITSYSTNREKIYHKNATTIEEVHILESSGRTTKNFAEEHWSSKIKSYVMPQPPKFIQIIKAFRVLATDTLTLVVEVQSDPPAIFEWFYNDKPVQQNRRKFKARHGINITTLTVEGPEQGVYKCTARNPVGISTTYGYVTVNAPPVYKAWLEQTHEIDEKMSFEVINKENTHESTDKSPKFVQQIPNLTLRPGNEAVIDVEVEASPPAKFIWYVNGVQFRDTIGQIEVFYPTANRCIARFPIPQKGEYKVTAENRAGKEHSIGYIDIKKEVIYHQTQLPPLPSDHMYHHHSLYNDSEYSEIPLLQGKGRASSLSRTVDFYEESSYYERSTSLPRQIDRPYEIRKRKDERQEEQRHREQQYSSLKELVQTEKELPQKMKRRRYSETVQRLMPQTPIFTNKLPTEVTIGSGEDLVLSVGIKAAPRADVKWSVNGFELKDSKKITVINNEDHSTLVVRPPVRYGRYCVVAKNEYGMSNQTTRVHHDEEKQYEEVGESHSLPPEITGNLVSACTKNIVLDEWELLDEHQRSSRSTDSFETIKHVETAQVLTKGHQTPIQHHAYTIGQFKESSDTKNTVNYEASTITSQPLLKLVAPVVHEPLQGENVSIVSEASRGSSYTERRYEETTSGVIYETLSPKLDKSILHKSLTDITFAKQRWEKTVHTRNEDIIHRMPSSKLQSRKEIGDDGIIERKVFRIPACHNVEPIPKRPFILKQPKPEIRLKAGEKLVLESKVDSMPASQFKWYQNNFEVRPSPSVIIENSTTNESRATFLKPVSGTYKIVASNIHGSCTSTTHVITEITEEWATESAVSVVKVAPEKQEPKYQLVKRSHIGTRNDLPKSPRIVEGFAPILKIVNNEPLVLRVIADAIPEAEFRWMLNNFEVRTSQTIAIERLGPNVSQITFYSPISGRYEVIATNSLGQDSCSGKIVVDYAEEQQVVPIQRVKKPAVPKIPVFINALPGETHLYSEEQEFRLSVSVSGEQPITFRWFADGSLLSNSVEHQMINDLENSTLVVRKQIGCDVDYAVEVSNAHGAAWSETTVKPPSLSASSVTSATSWENSLIEVNDAQRCFPHYTTVLMDKNLQQHDEFTAHVAISRESSPCEFVWMLNGRDIRTIPGFRVESTFHKSTLYIKSVLLKHSGELSVVASNKYGTVRSAAKINVHPSLEESHEFMSERRTMQTERPPRIVSPLQPSVFRAGESLELRCHVDALPRPEVFWTKDEIRINESVVDKGIITLQHPDGRYELINPKCALEDAGLYQLTARNIHGVTSTSAYIQIEREEVIETMTETKDEIQVIHRVTLKPRFSEVLSKEYDDKIIVSYKVISETPVMISWYKDGQQLYQSYKYRMQTLNDNTHTFIICSVDRWDEGTYTCCAENEYGRSETGIYIRPSVKIREISEQVLVEENDNEVIGLQDNVDYVKKKYTDTKVKLVEPTISGSQEMYSHTAELRKTEEQYKLLVKVAEIVASKLIAKVIIDEAIHIALRRMNVEVQSSEEEEFEQHPCPPRFETNIECYIVDVGDAVMLRTDISGYPQPCVEWYFGEEKVEQSEQIDVKYVNKQATLRIKKVEKKHEGTYYCHAGNEYGKAILPCNLCVTDVAQESSESVYKMIRPPLIYTLSETETEVSSNVHVTHAAESCDNYFSSIQPETFALGYSCFASTSKVLGDSVIITRESTQEMIEREQEVPEAFIMLNVNVERTPALFKHSVRILQSTDENVIISRHEPRYTRTEEVIQTNNILLIGDQRILQEYQFMVTTTATVIFEKPSQRALHEVICLYDEKAHVSKEKVQAANTIDLQKVEIVNELISAIMATKEKFREAYAEANVDVIRPDAAFDHFITVVESEDEHLKVHLVAPVLVRNLATFDFHFQRKRESLRAESVYIEHLRRNVTAEQKIILLESSFQKFTEAITWSLKKVSKEATENDIAHTNIKVHKPEEIGEYATTIVDTRKIAPELFAIAAAASKLKLINIFVTFTKKGDMAHQALVIEYENVVEDEAILNVAMLTAPGLRSKQESVWSYEKKYEKAEEIEANVVAVFVEVDAICPNQTIELVASVSLPPSIPGITDAARSSQPLLEPSSVSWSESSSTGLLQVPKFIKALETTTAVVGQFHQFKCIVSGTPAPRIRWFVDGDVIRDSEVYQTIYEDGVCILKIRELAIEDEGEYTCEAINDAGRAITKCFLQIITEADVLKYQQQAMFENILYSNGGNNNNNNNDNLASVDNISSLSNTDRIMYRNHAANCNDLIERDGNFRKHHLIVNYEFVRTEPVSAETVVIVTRYTSSKKEFRKNFASEERNFNISVFLPNAAMECASIWALTHCENIELFLMPSFQTMDLVIQKFQSQQLQKADFLLSIRKIMFENVSFAICQPWEEILLVKKPESAFIWDNEYYRRQKVRVEVSIKNSNENGYSQLSKNITMRTDCLGRSLHFYFDNVEADDATSLTSQENSIFQMKESINISEKAKNEQNDEIVRYKDEQEEAQIPVLVQEITKEKEVATDILAGDDLSRQTSKEYSGMSVSDMAAIRQYVDELFDFDQAVPISIPIGINSYKQRDANKLNMTGNQLGKPLDFINEEYLDCSFSRRSEHVEAIENRNSSASMSGILALSNKHLITNFSSPKATHLNSNPNSKYITSNKKSIESKTIIKPIAPKVDCDSVENSKENLSPASKECYKKLDMCSSFNTSNMRLCPYHSTETYSLHFNSIESVDIGEFFCACEEFEIFNVSDSRLQHNESFSISSHPNISNFCVLEAEHSKSHINSEFVNTSTSNTRISSKEPQSAHEFTAEELVSEIEVIDKIHNKVETEMKMKSEDNKEALQIERAIYDISEQIERQQCLTEAQAEASEELLKTILENIIMNTGQSSVIETMIACKKPVVLLREKLTELEETLLKKDLECRKSSKSIPEAQFIFSKSLNEEDLYAKSVQQNSIERKIRGASLCGLRQARIIDKEEIRRMTPLTSNIKEQLQSLECMLEEVEKDGENDMNELTKETKVTVSVYADDKQHEVHNILMQINNEISIIKRCCQRNISKTSIDTAVRLLHKVRNNVSSMIDLISLYRKRFKKKSPVEKRLNSDKERMKSTKRISHHLSPFTRTGFFFKTDASVNLYLVKREESELINAIVKLCISSDKLRNQMLKSKNSEISTYEDTVFDNKSKTLQGAKIDNVMRTVVSKPVTEKDDKFILSSFDESQNSSLSLRSLQNLQISFRRPRRISQQRADSLPPISPTRMKKYRSKSCNDNKNLIILCYAFGKENNSLPVLQNMTTSMHKKEKESQLDTSIYDNDRLNPVNIMNLVDIKEPNLLTLEQKSKLNEKAISSEGIIKKEGSFYSCSYTWPSKVEYHISHEMFDESSSIQLVCEDSDYAPESVMHSLLLFESTKRVQEEDEKELLQTLAFLSDLNINKAEAVAENAIKRQKNFAKLIYEREEIKSITPELDESYNQNISEYLIDMGQKISGNSKMIENPRSSSSEDDDFENIQKPIQHFNVSLNAKARGSTNALEDETNSLHEIESIDDKDEILDELDDLMLICNSHTSIIDSIDLLPTIMEDSENSKIANSFMSVSTNTVVAASIPNIDVQEKSQNIQKIVVEDGKKNDITTSTLKSSLELTAKTVDIPFNRSDKGDANCLNNYKKKVILVCESDIKQVSEETTINVIYKSCSSKLKVLAILSPEVRAKVEAFMVIGESFDVLIEQPDDAQDFTVKLLDHISDSVSLDLMLPKTVKVDLSLTRSGQCEGILSYQVGNLVIGNENDEERISMTSDDERHHHHSFEAVQDKEQHTGITVNIIARSMHDVARALLEEIPWGEVSMYITVQSIMTRSTSDSGTRNSLIQNVTVSESNETEKRSLHSHESFRSLSQQSFDWTEFSDQSASWQNLNVPNYVVREGSTATITCEFNNFLTPGSLIDWFKGKTMMQIIPGKIDRISHDLLEVLVISHVSLMDGDVYNIRVNDVIYPVACLIVENTDVSSEKLNDDIRFISPPQTLFVMEGQPSIISCQVNNANQKVEWCKDNKKWVTENERIRLEADQFGSHRIIIDKSELEDQGTYYAFLGDNFTTVTLVVEERIDEREVTISALGTDIKDDDYREYLVPLGSTATIACELENSDEVKELVWRKDGIQIEFSDDAKVEHVVNGLKHYLVIHDTQVDDSASYSICINDIEFKIAHLIVSSCAATIGSKHTIHISRNSLH